MLLEQEGAAQIELLREGARGKGHKVRAEIRKGQIMKTWCPWQGLEIIPRKMRNPEELRAGIIYV